MDDSTPSPGRKRGLELWAVSDSTACRVLWCHWRQSVLERHSNSLKKQKQNKKNTCVIKTPWKWRIPGQFSTRHFWIHFMSIQEKAPGKKEIYLGIENINYSSLLNVNFYFGHLHQLPINLNVYVYCSPPHKLSPWIRKSTCPKPRLCFLQKTSRVIA